jgi:FkbM family methyltransferase
MIDLQSEHHPVFARFDRWSGEVKAGWTVNFLGVRTREAFSAGMTGVVSSGDRWVDTEYPDFNEEYFEWIDVLEAALAATDSFTMIELGAGWGRWLMNGAAAARRDRDLPVRLIGVEAEPTHFSWLRQHFSDNGVDERTMTLIEAAVAAQAGTVRFHVGDPSAWYGQAIELDSPPLVRAPLRLRLRQWLRGSPGPEARRIVDVPAVTLASILAPLELVDLIDLDVQGAEADVLEAAADELARKVKRVHVGTHGEDVERRLRALFARMAWELRNDYAAGMEMETPWGAISFQDGVQTWINPRLARP